MKDIIPSAYRHRVYAIFATLGVLLGAVQVAFASLELGQPSWLTAALAVYGFVGGAVGLTAHANPTPDAPVILPGDPE